MFVCPPVLVAVRKFEMVAMLAGRQSSKMLMELPLVVTVSSWVPRG